MNAKDFQLTELEYDRSSILIRAIHASYQVYTQLNITGPLLTDLQEATRRLVVSLLWVRVMKLYPKAHPAEVMKDMADSTLSVIRVIEGACANKGVGYSDKFRAEFYGWVEDIQDEYMKLYHENDNSPSDQEGGKQV
jgi:hypothetical protein